MIDGKMKNQEVGDITCKKLAWTITNFCDLLKSLKDKNARHYSEVFIVGDCAWRLLMYKGKINGKSWPLAIHLEAADALSFPKGWKIFARYAITLVNQVTRKKSQTSGGDHAPLSFYSLSCCWVYPKNIVFSELEDPNSGYVLNDKCIVEVEFFSLRYEGMEPTSCPTYPSLTKQGSDVELEGDYVDFKNFGKIEKALVPMLEEVCLRHPSLMDSNKKRSRRFTEWAFTSLGQVLYFLENKNWKDMDNEACEQLEAFWEELEMSRLDLSWLEPQVKAALNMKGYLEKTMKMKRLKQDLEVLEKEMNQMKENLAKTEQMVEMTRKGLIKEQEGIEELDLDTKIGYEKA